MARENLAVVPLPGFIPEIGRWIWGLEDVHHTLLKKIAGLNQTELDTKINDGHSIGSLLYHIALIEADWFYEEVLGGEWNPKIRALFPQEDRQSDQTLTHIEGETIEEHVQRLQAVRAEVLSHFRTVDLVGWRTPRTLDPYDVTPEWVIYHLIEHEAHHRGQIFQMLSLLNK
ncbi:DinB family protein [Neobacillus jeddahensis]|uniref:DinB family protein n=1 Tax=Neobacillus jeddahensis TaxID=1461580 RepID=UPI00058B44D7|nr:DinB family protein [Neobacillus jeddahensis]